MVADRHLSGIQKIVVAFITLSAMLSFYAVAEQMNRSYKYAVVISEAAYKDAEWKVVADSLVSKHKRNGAADLITWSSSVTACKNELSSFKPDYIGFIARPATECNTPFVVAVSRLTRELDDDPYGDAIWGVITGYEAADALRAISESLTVKTVLAASNNLSYEPPIERFYQGIGMTCDSYTKTDYLFPGKSGKVYTENGRPQGMRDRINLVGPWLEATSLDIEISGQGRIEGPVDCFITGGHGNVNLWQCHYNDAGTEGYMRSSGGELLGMPYSGTSFQITAATPKIFWCATNCLMGNPDSKDNIVYAAFHKGHAVQMFGFMINASAGDEFMAWGIYDRVTKFAGSYTFADGFYYANNLAQFEVLNPTGLLQTALVKTFQDSTVFYGDPAADVRFHDFGDGAKAYNESLSYVAGENGTAEFTYSVTMRAHDLEFGAGYCYQFRPIKRLPVRIDPATVAVTGNEGHAPVITDDLLIWEMLSRGEILRKNQTKALRWTAVITDEKTGTAAAMTSEARRLRGGTEFVMLVSENGTRCTMELRSVPPGVRELRIFDLSGKALLVRPFAGNTVSWNLPYGSGILVAEVTVNGVTAARREVARY